MVGRLDDLREAAIASANRVLRDRHLSEDIAQETLMRALARWDRIESYAVPWASRVATNLAIDHHRRRRDVADGDLTSILHTEADGSFEPGAFAHEQLAAAVSDLTPMLRRTVQLRVLEDLDPDETARRLATSRAAVLKNTTRGLAALRRSLTA